MSGGMGEGRGGSYAKKGDSGVKTHLIQLLALAVGETFSPSPALPICRMAVPVKCSAQGWQMAATST